MSDFLSNFTNNNYSGDKEPKKTKKKRRAPLPEEETDLGSQPKEIEPVNPEQTPRIIKPDIQRNEPMQKDEPRSEKIMDSPLTSSEIHDEQIDEQNTSRTESSSTNEEKQVRSRFQEEETETDPDYQKKKIKKFGFIGVGIVVVCALLFGVYYQLTHVKVPDFNKKELSEARTWTSENDVKLKVEQVYDFDTEPNIIIKQGVAGGKKIKKGKELVITSSLGPDPDQKIALPEFKDFSVEAARNWVAENKAENVAIIEEYNDKIEESKFIKLQFGNKDLDSTEYKRKDKLQVYYSKGKEVFEKNIEVPDFKGKTKSEVQEWATKNELKLEATAVFSETVELDKVLSQETAKGTKIAKKDTFKVKISKGQAISVPDYSQYTVEEASQLESKVPAQIRSIYTTDVPYGRFISQSVEAGKQYNEGDALPNVKVLYSQGQPYLKDLRGQTVEGDLQKVFYDEFESKGANVTYEVYYVDSAESKGTVVAMSRFSEFIPIDAHIYIGISKGNLQPTEPASEKEQPAEKPAEEQSAGNAEEVSK